MLQEGAFVDYDEYMKTGSDKLNTGSFIDAADDFAMAAAKARSAYEMACAYQLTGVALRLDGNSYTQARIAFSRALILSEEGQELQFRIMRDEALLYADIGELLLARQMLMRSYQGLVRLGSKTEAAVSLAAFARIELRLSHDKMAARHLMIRADRYLRFSDNKNYELNNLVWLFKLVNPLTRLNLLPRVLRLIKQTNQRRRFVEVALLVVGGNRLYDIVESRYRRSRT